MMDTTHGNIWSIIDEAEKVLSKSVSPQLFHLPHGAGDGESSGLCHTISTAEKRLFKLREQYISHLDREKRGMVDSSKDIISQKLKRLGKSKQVRVPLAIYDDFLSWKRRTVDSWVPGLTSQDS